MSFADLTPPPLIYWQIAKHAGDVNPQNQLEIENMKIVNRKTWIEYCKAFAQAEKTIDGHNVCAVEIYGAEGEYIASALYEKIAGKVSATYRIKL